MNHPTSTTLSIPAYSTYTLDHTKLHLEPQHTIQHAVLLPNNWDHLPWDEEFHIEHHRENLRKVEDLLLQLLRIIHGD